MNEHVTPEFEQELGKCAEMLSQLKPEELSRVLFLLPGELQKAWDESKHPRDKDGKFIELAGKVGRMVELHNEISRRKEEIDSTSPTWSGIRGSAIGAALGGHGSAAIARYVAGRLAPHMKHKAAAAAYAAGLLAGGAAGFLGGRRLANLKIKEHEEGIKEATKELNTAGNEKVRLKHVGRAMAIAAQKKSDN